MFKGKFNMVSQLINEKGRAVANQFVITDGSDVNFQSYDSLVCSVRKGGLGFKKTVVLGCDYNYSNTTMRHLRKFLADNGVHTDSMKDLYDAINRGYMKNDETVAVWYDETMR